MQTHTHTCVLTHAHSLNWQTSHEHRNYICLVYTIYLCPAHSETLLNMPVNIWQWPKFTCTKRIPPASLRGEAREYSRPLQAPHSVSKQDVQKRLMSGGLVLDPLTPPFWHAIFADFEPITNTHHWIKGLENRIRGERPWELGLLRGRRKGNEVMTYSL